MEVPLHVHLLADSKHISDRNGHAPAAYLAAVQRSRGIPDDFTGFNTGLGEVASLQAWSRAMLCANQRDTCKGT